MSTASEINVAIIDDDENISRALGRVLEVSGMHSVRYFSARDFLSDNKCSQFDCLLLDIQLGDTSGIELSRRLIAAGSTTPVIFITAHDDPEVRERALDTGCAAYFRKSEPAEAVLAAIRKATSLHFVAPG